MVDGFCKPRCEDCCFFAGDPEDDTSGFCAFNPVRIAVHNDGWCGRWRNVFLEKYALWDVPEDVHSQKTDP